jgi:hypothetical protein
VPTCVLPDTSTWRWAAINVSANNRWGLQLQRRRLFAAALVVACALPLIDAAYGEDVSGHPENDDPGCVEPTEIMRRDHMEFILHQRDATVHLGIRTSKHSFKGCIDCHSTRDDDGALVRHDSEQHFCAGCHVYAAVRIDCFECHTDRPEKPAARLGAMGRISISAVPTGD